MIYRCNKKNICNELCADIDTTKHCKTPLTRAIVKELIVDGYYCKTIESKIKYISDRKLKLEKINERR